MKNSKIMALALTGIITASITLPSVQASAKTITNTYFKKEINKKTLSPEKLLELKNWMNSLKKDSENGKFENIETGIEPRSIGKGIVLKAGKWLMKNWYKVVAKAPKWLRPYLKYNFAIKVIAKYMDISTTIDYMVWGILRDLLPNWIPNPVVGGLKNVIVTIIPV